MGVVDETDPILDPSIYTDEHLIEALTRRGRLRTMQADALYWPEQIDYLRVIDDALRNSIGRLAADCAVDIDSEAEGDGLKRVKRTKQLTVLCAAS